MPIKLPGQFRSLEPFVEKWAKGTANQRHLERLQSTPDELKVFYEAIMPHIEDILKFLDEYRLGELPEKHSGLYWLALSLTEVAPHIEMYKGDTNVPHSFEEARFIAEHGEIVNV